MRVGNDFILEFMVFISADHTAHLNELVVVLHDDSVLVELAVEVRLGAALVEVDVERIGPQRGVRLDVDAIWAVELTFGEHQTLRKADGKPMSPRLGGMSSFGETRNHGGQNVGEHLYTHFRSSILIRLA